MKKFSKGKGDIPMQTRRTGGQGGLSKSNTISKFFGAPVVRRGSDTGGIRNSKDSKSWARVLVVHVKEGRALAEKNSITGGSDAYVQVQLGNKRMKSPHIPKLLNPTWNHTFRILMADEDIGRKLVISIWDYDMVLTHAFMGQVKFKLSQMEFPIEDTWKELKGRGNPHESITGEILVSMEMEMTHHEKTLHLRRQKILQSSFAKATRRTSKVDYILLEEKRMNHDTVELLSHQGDALRQKNNDKGKEEEVTIDSGPDLDPGLGPDGDIRDQNPVTDEEADGSVNIVSEEYAERTVESNRAETSDDTGSNIGANIISEDTNDSTECSPDKPMELGELASGSNDETNSGNLRVARSPRVSVKRSSDSKPNIVSEDSRSSGDMGANVVSDDTEDSGGGNVVSEDSDDNVSGDEWSKKMRRNTTLHVPGSDDNSVEENGSRNIVSEDSEGSGGGNIVSEDSEGSGGGNIVSEDSEGSGGGNNVSEDSEGSGGGNIVSEDSEGSGGGNNGSEDSEGSGGGNIVSEDSEGSGGGNIVSEDSEGSGGGNIVSEDSEGSGGGNIVSEDSEGSGGGNIVSEDSEGSGGGNIVSEDSEGSGGGNIVSEDSDVVTGGVHDLSSSAVRSSNQSAEKPKTAPTLVEAVAVKEPSRRLESINADMGKPNFAQIKSGVLRGSEENALRASMRKANFDNMMGARASALDNHSDSKEEQEEPAIDRNFSVSGSVIVSPKSRIAASANFQTGPVGVSTTHQASKHAKKMRTLTLNERFQESMSLLKNTADFFGGNPVELKQSYSRVIHIAQDFLHVANTYGKIIITERFLSNEEKTILPSDALGGRVGGEKYIVMGILFKFAIDSNNLFGGSDAAAAKAAGHELKGLVSYFNCYDDTLCFPLMCLIDYKGFRLMCLSLLPIDKSTIVSGSADAGKSVFASEPVVNAALKQCAQKLHLKGALRGLKSGITPPQLLYSAVDVEVHKGRDKRFYLLDFSRTFPPEAPRPRDVRRPGEHLYRMLRPEFVQTYPTHLNSDGFSRFMECEPNRKQHNKDIKEATKYLFETIIPVYAQDLVGSIGAADYGGLIEFEFSTHLHARGINIRHIGKITQCIRESKKVESYTQSTLIYLYVEMASRVCKAIYNQKLRDTMRRFKVPLEQPYIAVVVAFLNIVFGESMHSSRYWSTVIVPHLLSKFGEYALPADMSADALKHLIFNSNLSLRNTQLIGSKLLFVRLQHQTGFQLSEYVQKRVMRKPGKFFSNYSPFEQFQLQGLNARVKTMDIIKQCEANYLLMSGLHANSWTTTMSILQKAEAIYIDILSANPNNSITIRQYALCLAREAMAQENLDVMKARKAGLYLKHDLSGNQKMQRSLQLYERSLEIDPDDPVTHLYYARSLEDIVDMFGAEEHFLRCLELEPNNVSFLTQYSKFLGRCGREALQDQFVARIKRVASSQLVSALNAEVPTVH